MAKKAKKKRKQSKKKSKGRKVPAHFKPMVRQDDVVAKEEPAKEEPAKEESAKKESVKKESVKKESVKVEPPPPVAQVEEEPPPPPVAQVEEEPPIDEFDDDDEYEEGYDLPFSLYSHRDVPMEDWFEGRNLNKEWDLGEAIDNFVFWLESDMFFMWEAVIRREKGLPLSRRQKKTLSKLISFGDDEDEPIWYIDEMPRAKQTWYEIARRIAPRLLQKEPIYTSTIPSDVYDGWSDLAGAIEEHARDLSLPKGVNTPLEIFPRKLFHRLELQASFDLLRGLGQQKELNLEDQPWRLPDFLDDLRDSKASVAYFDLTLEKLLTIIIVPPNDEQILVPWMMEKLNLTSLQEPLAEKL